MKDFDIEKIKRENIFTPKENLFESMQAKVLAEVIPRKAGRIINLKWAYAAAAAVAMVFGLTFFNTTLTDVDQQENSVVENNTTVPKTAVSSAESVDETEKLAFTEKIPEAYLTSAEPIYPKENTTKAPIKVEQKVNIAVNKKEKTAKIVCKVDGELMEFKNEDALKAFMWTSRCNEVIRYDLVGKVSVPFDLTTTIVK